MAWWAYPTNYSNGSSIGGIGDFLFSYPIAIVGDKYAIGIIVLIWVALFSIMLVSRTAKSLAVSSFITFFFAMFFWVRGDVSGFVPMVLIVLTIIGSIGAKGETQL